MQNENNEAKDQNENSQTTDSVISEAEKVKIEFPYSEVVRAKIPKAFDVAENVATKWKNNEKFDDLGLGHPLAEVAAAKALEKAKEVEKKLDEKGVFTIAKMGVEIAKSQAQQVLEKFKK
jgi:hypothetical protein